MPNSARPPDTPGPLGARSTRRPGRPPLPDNERKKSKNMRLTAVAWQQLEAIAAHFGGTLTEAAEIAFDKLHNEIMADKEAKAKVVQDKRP